MLDLHSDFDLWLAEQVLVEWPKLGRKM